MWFRPTMRCSGRLPRLVIGARLGQRKGVSFFTLFCRAVRDGELMLGIEAVPEGFWRSDVMDDLFNHRGPSQGIVERL